MTKLLNRRKKKMRSKQWFFSGIVALVVLVSACSKVPKGVIPEKKMEDILYYSYLGEGLSETELSQNYNPTDARKEYLYSVLKKYDVSKAEYDSSLNWYMQNLKIYMKVYDKVIVRLKKEQSRMQLDQGNLAQEGAIATGDTVNIWLKKTDALLNELPAFSHYFAEIKANEGFHKGDLYKFSADARAFQLSANQYPKMVLTVVYANDSTQTITRKIERSSKVDLSLKTTSSVQVDRVIAGFSQNCTGVLMLENIKLIRIHDKVKIEPAAKQPDKTVQTLLK